jgi:hypothetical protein
MEILKNSNNLNIVVNSEQNFRTDLGWQDNLADFEDEVLKDIINPSKNYETVRYIHKPYIVTGNTYPPNFTQTDIWFQFYFATSGDTPNYVLDYNPVGISTQENQLMTKQSTESFFRLEFFKTPQKLWNDYTTFNFNDYVNYNNKKYKCVSVSGSTNNTPPISGTTLWWTFISENELACEPPTRQNRRLINSKNLALPLGEKYFHTGSNYGYNIFVPVFTGSNYRNKENMYLFWFDNESVLTDTNLSGTTTLDKYSFTATTLQTILFMNENNVITQVNIPIGTTTLIGWTGQTFEYPNLSYEIINNTNDKPGQKTPFYHGMNTFFMTAKFFNADRGEILDFINSGQTTSYNITEEKDMYYQIDFDHYERTYQIYRYTGTTKLDRIGTGYTTTDSITFYEKGGGVLLPVSTPTPTPIGGVTATPRPTSTPFPTSTPTPVATVIPTITPTPTESPCVTSVSFEVDFGGTVRYFNCEGSEVTETFGIGPQVINDCIQNNSLSGVIASISSVFYGETSCLPSTATPTPTSTPLPPTATPTPLPPTATPTPLPPTPTPFETTFSGYVSLVNGPTACTGGEYSNVNITVVGTSLCNLTKVKGLSSTMYGSVYGDMTNNTTFWVSDGTDEREFMRDGSAQTGTAQTACTSCSGPPPTNTPLPPTPTPTPGPVTTYSGCGYGTTEGSTCNDTENNRTLYSNCDSLSFGINCYVYVDTFPNPLTGYNFVQINGETWDINNSTGQITGLSSEQC